MAKPDCECLICRCRDSAACMTEKGPCYWLWVDRGLGIGICSACVDREVEKVMSRLKAKIIEWMDRARATKR